MLPTTCVRFGIGADRHESLGVLGALRGDEDAVRQRLAKQADQPPITVHRARRDARAGEHQRHAQPSAAVVEVRPDLGLEDDRELRPHALEEAAHRARQVDGHVAHVDAEPNIALARARPVGVTVVSTSGMSGKRLSSASTSGTAACTSPTDTACTQMLRWSGTFRPEAEALRKSLPVAAIAKAAQRQRADPRAARSDRRCRCRRSASGRFRRWMACGRPADSR